MVVIMSGSDKLERLTFLDDLVFIAKFIGFLLMMISLLLRWLYFDLELSGTIKDLLGVDYMECSANIIGKASAKNVVLESVSYKIELKIPLLRLIGSLIILLTLLLILETMWLLYSRQTAKGMKRIDKINRIYALDILISPIAIFLPLIIIGFYSNFGAILLLYERSAAGRFIPASESSMTIQNPSLGLGPYIALVGGFVWFISSIIQGISIYDKTK